MSPKEKQRNGGASATNGVQEVVWYNPQKASEEFFLLTNPGLVWSTLDYFTSLKQYGKGRDDPVINSQFILPKRERGKPWWCH
jgi:hypothetical protein